MENYTALFISNGKLMEAPVTAEDKGEAIYIIRGLFPVDGTAWVIYNPAELDGYTCISLDGGRAMARVPRKTEETLCLALWYVSEAYNENEREARRESLNKQMQEAGIHYRVSRELRLQAVRGATIA